ncbi:MULTISPECIES: hypothetical protein [Bacillus]|uniref:Uncharacterized protein n=1 Tax=Bacillus pumilus TaxID=1408 RepID=A0A9Q9T5E6_BACPU|nr:MULTISPECIES: hypothetical protein [Bacillus]MCY7707970.1 hypothetical protein [Bacillus safensis]MCY7727101.1 hypothetical protein [Bacillus safensis]MED4592411.1 hypothetical protein [Bacillus safensis]MED4639478.1 hypothetical protein [Bacillus safensis]MEE3607373.1 hypothetical protein [Bacillus altitudinis]
MPNITIKGLSLNTKNRLTDLAKKSGVSEQKYLKMLLDKHVLAEEIEGVQSTYEELCKMALSLIEKNTEVLNEFIKIMKDE